MRTYLTDVVRDGRLDLIAELAHEDVVDEANQVFGGPAGRDGLVAHVVGFRKYVTELSVEIQEIVGGDDAVMAWWAFKGRHCGPWLGREPTGKIISGDVFSFFQLREGKAQRYRLWLYAAFPEPVVFDTSKPEDGPP